MQSQKLIALVAIMLASGILVLAYYQMFYTIKTKNVQTSLPRSVGLDTARFISLKAGSQAPDFSLPSVSGKNISLKNEIFSAKPVVILTMAPGCASCTASLKPLSAIHDEYAGRIAFIGFNVGLPDMQYLKEYIAEQGFKGEYVSPDEDTLKNYGIISTDILYVIGRDGIVKQVRNSVMSEDAWIKVFEEVL